MAKVIIDVREPFEFMTGHVKGALNIPPAKLMAGATKLQTVPKNAEIILYCRTGSRSAVAANILRSATPILQTASTKITSPPTCFTKH